MRVLDKAVSSFKKNKIGISIMLLASLCTALGQMFWKLSEGGWNWELLLGFFLYFMGAASMITAFRFGDLSLLHPLLSAGYVIALFLGIGFLGEAATAPGLLGTAFIVAGAVLIGGGDH
ncbi:EamA family transporter [Alteribacillus sp. HJP-4]|uniref:EamA family transporter n=1 Tax=Alteribacillus sp. HJP-4 TaxID=2775394 RepID=UPI0035CD0A84